MKLSTNEIGWWSFRRLCHLYSLSFLLQPIGLIFSKDDVEVFYLSPITKACKNITKGSKYVDEDEHCVLVGAKSSLLMASAPTEDAQNNNYYKGGKM